MQRLANRLNRAAEKRRERLQDDRGAVIIESAIVMTMMLVIFFGVLEFGIAIRHRHGLGEASRTGVRAASSLSRVEDYHLSVAEAVSASLRESGVEALTLTVYKADPVTGNPVSGTFEACNSCYKFVWNDATETFVVSGSSNWVYTNQAACGIGAANDYVGIYLTGHYRMITAFWSDTIELAQKSVMRLEPVSHNAVCN